MAAKRISLTRLKMLLHYSPHTGRFTWHVSRGSVKAGQHTGKINKATGYRYIRIDDVLYAGGPLAWFYMTGQWPTHDIDHKNRDKADDRFQNLREATDIQSSRNRRFGNGASGEQNIYPRRYPSGIRYAVQFNVNHTKLYFGLFKTIDEAITVRNKAAKNLYGDFSPFNVASR